MSHRKLFIIGFVLVLIGAVLPFVMVIQIVESTLLLNFVAAISSIFGLLFGVIGAATYIAWKRQSDDQAEE